MNERAAGLSDSESDSQTLVVRGTLLGLTSAISYSAANIFLRHLAHSEEVEWAMFISATKAVPCCLLSWFFVTFRLSKGLPAFPRRKNLLPLLSAALMMQFGGNAAFCWALSKVGLVLTVPLTFATLILGSAILGRIFLEEPITRKVLVSIMILMASIVCLSAGADKGLPHLDTWSIVTGILLAMVAGFSYGANSIVIRKFVSGSNSVSSVLVVMSTTGVLVLGSISLSRLGWDRIGDVTGVQWRSIAMAGFANAIAFYSVSTALKYIPAVRANLLNASQTAMCSIAGILLFQEHLNLLLGTGILLTIAGLSLLGLRRQIPQPERATMQPASVGQQNRE